MEYDMRDRIIDKLNEIDVHLNRIKSIRVNSFEDYKNADPNIKYSTERNLQLISDAELDVVVLMYKKFGRDVAGSLPSMIKSLKSVLGSSLLEYFDKRRELRNRLVHVYKEFSFDKEVFESSRDTVDIEAFVQEIKKIINKNWT